MKAACVCFSLLVTLGACASAPPSPPSTEPSTPAATAQPAATSPARPEDVGSVDAIIGALYDVISGPPRQDRDWNRFRSLFTESARLIIAAPSPQGRVPSRSMTPDEFVASADAFLKRDGFWEREIARRTERYGNVTHAFSTYESRVNTPDSPPFSRGINSIQLVTNGERWWVVTILWDFERPGNPIPAEYLPK
jgi:hypothetical protein